MSKIEQGLQLSFNNVIQSNKMLADVIGKNKQGTPNDFHSALMNFKSNDKKEYLKIIKEMSVVGKNVQERLQDNSDEFYTNLAEILDKLKINMSGVGMTKLNQTPMQKGIQKGLYKTFFGANKKIADQFEAITSGEEQDPEKILSYLEKISKSESLRNSLNKRELKALQELTDTAAQQLKTMKQVEEVNKYSATLMESNNKNDEILDRTLDKLNLGKFGSVLGNLSKSLNRSKTIKAINEKRKSQGLEQLPEMNNMKGLFKGITSTLGEFAGFAKSLLGIGGAIAIVGAGIYSWYNRSKIFRETTRDIGRSAGLDLEAVKPYQDLLETSASITSNMRGAGIEVEKFGEQISTFLEKGGFGGDLQAKNMDKLIVDATILNKEYGIQLDLQRLMTDSSGDALKAHLDLTKQYNVLNRKGISFKNVMSDVSDLSGNINLYFKKGINEAVKFAGKVRGIGFEMNKVIGFQDKFFDYGEALDAANTINQLLGDTISANEAMELYSKGPEEAAKVMQKIVEKTAGMEGRQLKMIADEVGLTVDQITDARRLSQMGDKFKTTIGDAVKNSISNNPELKKSIEKTFDISDASNIDQLFAPENINALVKVAGSVDNLADVASDPSKQADFIKKLSEMTGKEFEEITQNRTMEEKMFNALNATKDLVYDIFKNISDGEDTTQEKKDKEAKKQVIGDKPKTPTFNPQSFAFSSMLPGSNIQPKVTPENIKTYSSNRIKTETEGPSVDEKITTATQELQKQQKEEFDKWKKEFVPSITNAITLGFANSQSPQVNNYIGIDGDKMATKLNTKTVEIRASGGSVVR